MSNILTNLTSFQEQHYGSSREAFSLIDVAGKCCIGTTWGEFRRNVDSMACALEILGIAPCDMVAIIAHNCPEILVTDFGAYRNRAVPVSIYATSSPEQIRYIINDSGAKAIVAGSAAHYRAVRSVADQCPTLEKIIVIDRDVRFDADDSMSLYFGDVLELGSMASAACRAAVDKRSAQASPDDIATLIYTSGTTGEPKGAVLPHSCFNAALEMHRERLTTISDSDTSVCFLPLSHIFEKAWTYFCLYMGMRVAINPNPKEIQDAIPLAKPTCMCSVPRFWEKVYTGVQEKIAGMKGVQKFMVERALKVGAKRNLEYVRLGLKTPWWLEKQYQFFDKNVFSKVRAVLGLDNGRFFPTAGAPLSANITEFFHAMGINIVIGYGLSETTATVSCFPDVDYVIGTVGTTLPGVMVKIGEENEILVKGPTVMRGYYNRPDENAKVFTEDGWFRTGDAGLFDHSGALVLTERLKDLFKTSNGKYIAPQAIESRLGEDRYIEQVAVIGDRRKYVTAVIVPAFGALKEYARRKGIQFSSVEELVENAEIRKFIAERIERLQKGFAGFEKVKRFTLLPKEFSIESGELTNTLKIRRPVINSMYADEIEAMYC
ncbi:MAG: long-chain fatty acid--CoA ligase [Muribaculaceae bacterium]|nr:long-chain fatty acid--CoA ligase [Muribaculaceae bacterium]